MIGHRRKPSPLDRFRAERGVATAGKVQRRSTRVRDSAYMHWVRTLPCVCAYLGECSGVMEADHDNRGRGKGQKASDRSTWPMCTHHHRLRTDFHGHFHAYDQARMRRFMDAARLDTTMRFSAAFPTVGAWTSWCEARGLVEERP